MPDDARIVLRPSRRPLVGWGLVLVLAAICNALAVAAKDDPILPKFLLFLAPAAVLYLLPPLVRMFAGRTTADAAGLRTRVIGERGLPWPEISELRLVPAPFGWRVGVQPREGRTLPLAAPTSNLLRPTRALTADLDALRALSDVPLPLATRPSARPLRVLLSVLHAVVVATVVAFTCVLPLLESEPWHAYWWPGVAVATALPDACPALPDALTRPLVPATGHGSEERSRSSRSTHCSWGDHPPEIGLTYDLDFRTGAADTSAGTANKFRIWTSADPCDRVPGPGDEACLTAETFGGTSRTRLLIRRANVLVTVVYNAPVPRDRAVATVRELGATALKPLVLR